VGVTDVVGVWQHIAQLMTVVAVKQRYAGHAKRAALVAAANSYMARLIVVVDDDVDPSNLGEVLWAVTTRCEPSEQIDIVRDAWSSALDPRIPLEQKLAGATSQSVSAYFNAHPRGGTHDRVQMGGRVKGPLMKPTTSHNFPY
jgi:UbiD family decarboxylase